jgi:hypothetical protein
VALKSEQRDLAASAALVSGAALIVAGVALLSIAAGLIIAGLLLVTVTALLLALNAPEEARKR